MDNESALDERKLKFDGWNGQNLVMALKVHDGRYALDVRKWYESENGNYPMRKGISLSPDQWLTVISNIQEMLDKNGLSKANE